MERRREEQKQTHPQSFKRGRSQRRGRERGEELPVQILLQLVEVIPKKRKEEEAQSLPKSRAVKTPNIEHYSLPHH